MVKVKAKKLDLVKLPPRHARGCPRNILRSAAWSLAASDLSRAELGIILAKMRGILPCLCPKKGA